MFLIFDSFRV